MSVEFLCSCCQAAGARHRHQHGRTRRLWHRLQPLATDKMPLEVPPPRSSHSCGPLLQLGKIAERIPVVRQGVIVTPRHPPRHALRRRGPSPRAPRIEACGRHRRTASRPPAASEPRPAIRLRHARLLKERRGGLGISDEFRVSESIADKILGGRLTRQQRRSFGQPRPSAPACAADWATGSAETRRIWILRQPAAISLSSHIPAQGRRCGGPECHADPEEVGASVL